MFKVAPSLFSSVIEAINNDTVLFLLGDHGMTRTGDHGGDSKDELDAALFVFSPIPLLSGSKTAQVFLTCNYSKCLTANY